MREPVWDCLIVTDSERLSHSQFDHIEIENIDKRYLVVTNMLSKNKTLNGTERYE